MYQLSHSAVSTALMRVTVIHSSHCSVTVHCALYQNRFIHSTVDDLSAFSMSCTNKPCCQGHISWCKYTRISLEYAPRNRITRSKAYAPSLLLKCSVVFHKYNQVILPETMYKGCHCSTILPSWGLLAFNIFVILMGIKQYLWL